MSQPSASLSDSSLWRWLGAAWWVVFPGFLVLVLALVRERACFDRDYPLPAIATRPVLAWLVAGFYLLAHVWLVAAYRFTVIETQRLLPGIGQAHRVWGSLWLRLWAMIGVFSLEHCPAEMWLRIGRMTGCGA